MTTQMMTPARVNGMIEQIISTSTWRTHMRAIGTTAEDVIDGHYIFPKGQPSAAVLRRVREAAARLESCYDDRAGGCLCGTVHHDTVTLTEELTIELRDYLRKFV